MQILITGICGSLGRAFTKLLQDDHQLIGYDNSEWSVAEFQRDFPGVDIKLEDFSEWKFDQDPVDLVIHAAAYKHLPLGEANVNAFIDNNIIKTRKLFAEAFKNNAEIIFISTDKAVEPQSLYGYTKAIGEKLAKFYEGHIARCGNFLNSSGSVIPVWEKAIKEGRPIPITDLKMKRFVIEVDDAAKQIWRGYANRESLIIPKCEEVSITELIRRVAKSNYHLGKIKADEESFVGFEYEIIGVRNGEKLQEKLRWDWE